MELDVKIDEETVVLVASLDKTNEDDQETGSELEKVAIVLELALVPSLDAELTVELDWPLDVVVNAELVVAIDELVISELDVRILETALNDELGSILETADEEL